MILSLPYPLKIVGVELKKGPKMGVKEKNLKIETKEGSKAKVVKIRTKDSLIFKIKK